MRLIPYKFYLRVEFFIFTLTVTLLSDEYQLISKFHSKATVCCAKSLWTPARVEPRAPGPWPQRPNPGRIGHNPGAQRRRPAD